MERAVDIKFRTGWNLISLPYQPPQTNIQSVLDPVLDRVKRVWSYENGVWYMFDPQNPGFTDLSSIQSGFGYYVFMDAPGQICGYGTETAEVQLDSGWNLVGYSDSSEMAIIDAIASIADKVEIIWQYRSGTWKMYDPANPGFSDLLTMAPGYGYWIKVKEACTWTLP